MQAKYCCFIILALAGALAAPSMPAADDAAAQPHTYVYREVDGQKLSAFVFQPQGGNLGKPTAAVLCFHGWFVRLLQGRASAAGYSPLEHAGSSTPPTCIVNGDKDTLTPLSKAERFRDRVVLAGGACALHVYPGVGHLLTRNLTNQEENFDPHPEFKADGMARLGRFLRERGFLSK